LQISRSAFGGLEEKAMDKREKPVLRHAMAFALLPLLAGIVLGFTSCCHRWQSFGRYMEPGKPVLDVNKVVAARCANVFERPLLNGRSLQILAPRDLKIDGPRILATYERMIAAVQDLSGRMLPKEDFRLIVLPLESDPATINYRYVPPGDRFTELALLKKDAPGDVTERILCDLAGSEPHGLWYELGRATMARPGRFTGAGWFEEGLECYVSYLTPIAICKPKGHTGARGAALAFADAKTRAGLWTTFCPGCEKSKIPDKRTNLNKDEIAAFWKPIDQGYDASLGAFLFLERKLGREMLREVIRSIYGVHHYQDEAFYKDLARLCGFDVRSLTTEEVAEQLKDMMTQSE
jgi:hypothetical protein